MIDFANSSPKTYGGSTEEVMTELNNYFRSYINGNESNDTSIDKDASFGPSEDFDENLDSIIHKDNQSVETGLGFDDALDSINRSEKAVPFDADLYEEAETALLDTDVLDTHIDKSALGLSGGNDAIRAIENMEGGACGKKKPKEESRDEETRDEESRDEETFELNMIGDDEGGMLGGRKRGELRCNDGPMQGYSGVRHELRKTGKTFRETDRQASNYINEDGVVDFNMVGGSFEDVIDNAEKDRDDNESSDVDDGEENTGDTGVLEITIKESSDEDKDDESSEESDEEIEIKNENTEVHKNGHVMANEIDRVLAQLRSKTGRTLTGGTIPIRKKVVLSDMYPYILRS